MPTVILSYKTQKSDHFEEINCKVAQIVEKMRQVINAKIAKMGRKKCWPTIDTPYQKGH